MSIARCAHPCTLAEGHKGPHLYGSHPEPTRQTPARDAAIKAQRKSGRTLDQLSWDFGLSRERIRQVTKEDG